MNFFVEIMKLAEDVMREEACETHLNVDESIEEIINTDEYLFLVAQNKHIDTEEFLINFIRFTGRYVNDPTLAARMFMLFIRNVQRVGKILNDPALMFTTDASRENLLMGFFVDHNKG